MFLFGRVHGLDALRRRNDRGSDEGDGVGRLASFKSPTVSNHVRGLLFHSLREEDGKLFLRSIPILLNDYQPYYGYLPYFLYRLASAVDYSDEDRCLEGISREVSRFYSFLPGETQEAESEEWENVVQCVLYPNLKKLLLLSDRLWTNGTIQVIATTDRLYRVFERCWGCLFFKPQEEVDSSQSPKHRE